LRKRRHEPFLSMGTEIISRTSRSGSVLQCVAVCCSVLQCVAVWCNVLCVAVCCSVLQCVAVCCSVLQCVAMCCSVLQWVAVCCSVLLQCIGLPKKRVNWHNMGIIFVPQVQTHRNTLQHTATPCNTPIHVPQGLWGISQVSHCNTLQHIATHRYTLQHPATHCNTLQHTGLRTSRSMRDGSSLTKVRHGATSISSTVETWKKWRIFVTNCRATVNRCVAVCCSVLQCVAACCSVLQVESCALRSRTWRVASHIYNTPDICDIFINIWNIHIYIYLYIHREAMVPMELCSMELTNLARCLWHIWYIRCMWYMYTHLKYAYSIYLHISI